MHQWAAVRFGPFLVSCSIHVWELHLFAVTAIRFFFLSHFLIVVHIELIPYNIFTITIVNILFVLSSEFVRKIFVSIIVVIIMLSPPSSSSLSSPHTVACFASKHKQYLQLTHICGRKWEYTKMNAEWRMEKHRKSKRKIIRKCSRARAWAHIWAYICIIFVCKFAIYAYVTSLCTVSNPIYTMIWKGEQKTHIFLSSVVTILHLHSFCSDVVQLLWILFALVNSCCLMEEKGRKKSSEEVTKRVEKRRESQNEHVISYLNAPHGYSNLIEWKHRLFDTLLTISSSSRESERIGDSTTRSLRWWHSPRKRFITHLASCFNRNSPIFEKCVQIFFKELFFIKYLIQNLNPLNSNTFDVQIRFCFKYTVF